MAFDLGTIRHAQCNVHGLSSDMTGNRHYHPLSRNSQHETSAAENPNKSKTHKVNERNKYSNINSSIQNINP